MNTQTQTQAQAQAQDKPVVTLMSTLTPTPVLYDRDPLLVVNELSVSCEASDAQDYWNHQVFYPSFYPG